MWCHKGDIGGLSYKKVTNDKSGVGSGVNVRNFNDIRLTFHSWQHFLLITVHIPQINIYAMNSFDLD